MPNPNAYFSHVYGVELTTARGTTRTARLRANSIGEARSFGKSMEQNGEELFAAWLIG